MFQIRRMTKVFSSLAFLAAIGLTLGFSSWTLGKTSVVNQKVSATPSLVVVDTGIVNDDCNTAPVNPFEPGIAGEMLPDTVSMANSAGTCYADIFGPFGFPDGYVNVLDLLFLLGEWGPDHISDADINANDKCDILICDCDLEDFDVDAADLLCLFSEWGPCQ